MRIVWQNYCQKKSVTGGTVISKPLTIDELKSLKVGDWVWLNDGICKGYRKITLSSIHGMCLGASDSLNTFRYSDYGTTWLAYKNKEQAEGKDTEMIERIEKAYEHNVAECERCIKKVDIKHQFAMENMKEHIRKDTAKEIYKKINNIDVNALDWEEAVFAVFEQYGVEVDE